MNTRFLLLGVALLVNVVYGGIAEDRLAAAETHTRREARKQNYHSPDRQEEDHKGHPGHGGTHMHEMSDEELLEYHELDHHSSGSLPVKHRLPPGHHGIPEHKRPDKDQKGSHHNPPEQRHVLVDGMHDFGIDIHTGRKRVSMKDLKEHVWDKNDPDHPHAHKLAPKRRRRRKFKDHPMRKYDWMEDEASRLAHLHTEALHRGEIELAEEYAHNKSAIDKELRHLDMLHHGMTEEEYQEYKGWQAELEELNKVDSHAMDKEEKVKHRDRMVELSRAISSTKQHYSFVPQPRVHAHATLEDNVKMHKLWEAIHKTNDKDERAKLKKELEDLRERLRFDAKHRTFDEDDVATINSIRAQIEESEKNNPEDHLEREKLRTELQGIYLSYEKRHADEHGHIFPPHAHDEMLKEKEAHDETAKDGEGPSKHEFADDPELVELHEELHHVESHQYEEKQRIDNRIKLRMYELQHSGRMHSDHIRGHLHSAINQTEFHEKEHGHDPPREAEAPPDRSAKPIIVL